MIHELSKSSDVPLELGDFHENNDFSQYIDYINYRTIFQFVIGFIIFELGYIFLAVTSPQLIISNTQTFFFYENQTNQNIRLAIERLHNENKFIMISAQLIQSSNTKNRIFLLMNSEIRFYQNSSLSFNTSASHQLKFQFKSDSLSEKIIICDQLINNFDSLILSMIFQVDIEQFSGIKLDYICLNPNGFILIAQSLNRFIIISLFFIIFYFILYRKITKFLFLIIFSIIAMNPFRLFQPLQYKEKVYMTCITFSLFLGFERFILFSELFKNYLIFVIFFVAYSVCELYSKINEFSLRYRNYKILYPVTYFHLISIFLFIYFIFKKSVHILGNQRKFVFYISLNTISLSVTIFTQLICPYYELLEASPVPLYTYLTTHILIVYLLVFVNRPITRQEILESDFQRSSLPY